MSVLRVSDAFCYICRGVLIKPVTVPCHHVFCFTCFEQSMQETSYSCPLCRKRISNWVRKATKTDKLIDVELWQKIQEQFPEQVKSKLHGEDDGLDERLKEDCPNTVNISGPGEVAEEFSKFIHDYQVEREKLQAAEELASKQLISKITAEEEIEIEALKRDNALKIAMDEEFAKKLHKELNKKIPRSSQNNSSKRKQKTERIEGPMDKFLRTGTNTRRGLKLQLQEERNNRCASEDSTDSIQPEMHYFKPIKVVPRTPPKRYPDGKVLEISVTEVKPMKALNSQNGIPSSYQTNNLPESQNIYSPFSAFAGESVRRRDGRRKKTESSRKRMRPSDESESVGVLKEITLGENSDTNSMDTDDSFKRKRSSPATVKSSHTLKKSVKNDIPLTSNIFDFNTVEGSPEENENSDMQQQCDTQDYLDPDADTESDVVNEQRQIEKLILQEKTDHELALKLSQEWEGRYELRKKPMQKQVTTTRRMKKRRDNKKLHQTLISNLINTRSKNKL